MFRSILSVLAGFACMAMLVGVATFLSAKWMLGATDRASMMSAKPTPAFTAINLAYSALFAIAGGFLTAVLAPGAPLKHALALGALMFAMAIFSFFQSAGSNQPKW